MGGIGNIYYNNERNTVNLIVSSLEELKVIISHFDKYPFDLSKACWLFTLKRSIYDDRSKEHLNPSGLQTILNIRASINLRLSESLTEAFPNTVAVNRPLNDNPVIPDPQWVAGFSFFLIKKT